MRTKVHGMLMEVCKEKGELHVFENEISEN